MNWVLAVCWSIRCRSRNFFHRFGARRTNFAVQQFLSMRGGTIDFYVDTDVSSGLSSIHADHFKSWGGGTPERITVPCVTVARLLETAGFVPDILLIDAEGEDEAILRSVPLADVPVAVVCIEVCGMEADRYFNLVRYMNEQGYDLYSTTQRRVNSVFVRRTCESKPFTE